MRGRRRGASPFIVGFGTLAVILIACFFAFTKSNPFANPYEFKAAFRNVNQLKTKSQVRIAGVNVGTVKKVEALGEGQTGALVTMHINKEGLPLHRDAQIKIRPRIFLEGNYFVDVKPGSPSAPVLEKGETIPVNQTAAPVQLGDVFSALQDDTREDLRRTLQQFGRAIDSDGGDGYNRSIKYWRPAFKNSAIVNEAMLGEREHDLSGYLEGFSKVAAGLDRNPERLKSLITDFAATADALASEQQNLSAAIRQLPRTLRTGRRALGTLNEAFPPLRRFVADARPTVRSSRPALEAQLPFVRQMRRLVSRPELQGLTNDLRPLVPNLVELNRGGVALQHQQRDLSSCQNRVIIPWQEEKIPDPNFESAGAIYQEGSKQFVGLGAESRSFDANGQYVRSLANNANYAYALGDGRFFLTSSPLQGVNPPKKQDGPPAYRPEVPCETQEQPDLRSIPAAPPQGRKIDQNAPGAAERRAKAQADALDWMREEIKRTGWDSAVKLSDEPLTRSQIDLVRKTLGPEAVK
jgi:phospholipid/cholesterol/gamma-HCH transport system substrate-binding protein